MAIETQIILLLVVPALLSLFLTPAVIRLATVIGAIDHPNERKVHRQPIPRLGGVAIFGSFLLTLFTFSLFHAPASLLPSFTASEHLVLLGAVLTVFLLGVWDDLKTLSPGFKLCVQIFAATLAYYAGARISSVTSPFGVGLVELEILDYPATVLWIVGVSNAFNLIDGLDGLAAGVGIIASLTIVVISFLNGTVADALPVIALAGALAGFLYYNFHPARVFLGDSGSLLLGFVLSVCSMQTSTKGSTAFALLIPVLALGLPIMDTLLSMIRRFLASLLPKNTEPQSVLRKLSAMFLPDRKHIHHQLMALGVPHHKVVLLLYAVSIALGIGAFAVTVLNNVGASLILTAVALATIVGIRQLQYKEMAILRNGLLLPIYDWPVVHRSFFQGFLDLAFSAAAFAGTFYLNFPDRYSNTEQLVFLLPFVCGVQTAVFFTSGLYRCTLQYLGIGDLLRMMKTVLLSVIATGFVLALLPTTDSYVDLTVLLTDFYLLFTLVAGSRASFHILNYLSRREPKREGSLLIYGADARGMLVLQRILHDNSLNMSPIGFLDDKPQMEGKTINGFPVFGGHWKIPQVAKKYRVNKILLSTDMIPSEVFQRLQHLARTYGISLMRSTMFFEEIATEAQYAKRPMQQTLYDDDRQRPLVGMIGT